jgi:hypothetical protein
LELYFDCFSHLCLVVSVGFTLCHSRILGWKVNIGGNCRKQELHKNMNQMGEFVVRVSEELNATVAALND